jgi:uncharacterized protein
LQILQKLFPERFASLRLMEVNEILIIENAIAFVQDTLKNAEGGHDWWHIHRVYLNAKRIASIEEVDTVVVELAALLHDISDSKFNGGNETLGAEIAGDFLRNQGLSASRIEHVVQIINHISFKGGKEKRQFHSKEFEVVQDADRLDAIGAIGVARTFNYGGFKGNEIYNPNVPPNLNMTKEEYKKGGQPSINHFYEKLLLLKDLMNTKTGQEMAEQRHAFMELYLKQFFEEVDGMK